MFSEKMFSDKINIPLDAIDLINLTYYSAKSEIMHIYDTNFAFDENIIPLITSFLETKPDIINAKRYNNINCESIITINNQLPNKSQLAYPCFFSDIHNNNLNMKNIQGYRKNLVSSYDDNNLLVKMYKLENTKGEYSYNILNESELTIISWSWDYANFQIIINKNTPDICQLQINIYITEDNKIITTKMENINKLLLKIDKIKNDMISRTK